MKITIPGEGVVTYRTRNSVYRVDWDQGTVVRLYGDNEPTPRFSDGKPVRFKGARLTSGARLVFYWSDDKGCTVTSELMRILGGDAEVTA